MNNALTTTNDKDEFIKNLNQATNFNSKIPQLPVIKFDGTTGKFLMSDGKDDDGKTKFKELGTEISFHIIKTDRKFATIGEKQGKEFKTIAFSNEYVDSYLELQTPSGEIFDKGFYKALKEKYGDKLKYTQVLYGYYNEEPVRLKLNGGKLSAWFDYSKEFKQDNPARFITKFSQGKFVDEAIKYYEIKIERDKEINDQQLIIDRVKGINDFIDLVTQNTKQPIAPVAQIEAPSEAEQAFPDDYVPTPPSNEPPY